MKKLSEKDLSKVKGGQADAKKSETQRWQIMMETQTKVNEMQRETNINR